LVKNGFVLVKLGLPLGCFQRTHATLSAAEFRQLLAADGSGVLALRIQTKIQNSGLLFRIKEYVNILQG
tara:strand:+ start:101 stop:307 length:207 start_codon:yes stop_codon:yes gene_type:complete